MNDLIKKLSNLRSQFNCFDENERDAYNTLSEAIKVISERPEPCEDTVSRAYKRGRMEVLQECDDIVSRKAALNLLYDILDRVDQVATVDRGIYIVARNRMDALPPVTPKRKAMICGACSYSDSKTLYATNPPKIQCMKTGNLHFTTDYCDCDEINVEEQKSVHDVIN